MAAASEQTGGELLNGRGQLKRNIIPMGRNIVVIYHIRGEKRKSYESLRIAV
jgi:hypothetical protein